MEISKVYEPKEVEKKWLNIWEKNKLYHSEPDNNKKPFTIVIPPPNVTGSLHMGHALNNLLQDIIIRFKRMHGFNVCWVPGTDHGGIATQNIMEKELKKEDKNRDDFTRDQFVNIMQSWAIETGNTIISQLKKLGCSCDWDRLCFTMDEKRSRAVNYAFIEFFNKGLIYRGERIVDWCPRCGTALNESEVEQEDEKGKLWYIKYPLEAAIKRLSNQQLSETQSPNRQIAKSPDYITVATTRPETMLGDTAVAVNPADERYKNYIGQNVVLPLVNRIIPVIADEIVDPKFGTGAVKVTPAHDKNDAEIAKRHNLVFIHAINKEAKITSEIKNDLSKKIIANFDIPEVIGKDRYEARKIILEKLNEKNLLEKEENYMLPITRCYRCETPTEPLISKQWFLKMARMAKMAVEAAKKDEIKFFPDKWLKPYLMWLENLKDWCISRQIWWGHRIPLWYCKNCVKKIEDITPDTNGVYASETKPNRCSVCGKSDFVQDTDVLDTWFSSALWPLSVFGWPENTDRRYEMGDTSKKLYLQSPISNLQSDLSYYYPTSVLVTGHEILYLWVARMVMMGLEFKNQVPYSSVYIHGIVRDSKGKKMSKSLGNVIDPLTIMEKYGTDALRFALAYQAVPGRDMQISDDNFIMARNFCNKLWNVSRFVLMNLGTQITQIENADYADLELTDRWILSELNFTVKNINDTMENYNPSEACRLLYDFIWSKYCDWYVEFSKTRLYGTDEKSKLTAQKVHLKVLENILKLLHPIMPFITEEIYQNLQSVICIMVSEYPKQETFFDLIAQTKIQKIIETITSVRNIRSVMNIKPADIVDILIKTLDASEKIITENKHYINSLAKVGKIDFTKSSQKPKHSASAIVDDIEIFVLLEDKIDFEKEKKRLNTYLTKMNQELKTYENKIANRNFLEKANPIEVERIKQKYQETNEKKTKIEQLLDNLGEQK
ncbi:MAG: valine--tRNA ligase [Elusimicrobiota bacterium]